MASSFASRLGTAPEEGMKAPCVVASTTNITLSGEQTISSIAVVAGDRVLAAGQTDKTENGIYDAAAGAWTRATDWNDAQDVITGQLCSSPSAIYAATFTGTFAPGTSSVTMTNILLASSLVFAPAGNLAATDIQAALVELDDEKEPISINSSWTPILADDSLDTGGEGQSGAFTGKATKTGRVCHFDCRISASSLGTLTTTHTLRILGLPYVAAELQAAVSVSDASALAIPVAGQVVTGFIPTGTAYIGMQLWDATTGVSGFLLSELTASGALRVSGTYITV